MKVEISRAAEAYLVYNMKDSYYRNFSDYLLHDGGLHHMETSPLIGNPVLKELRASF